MCNGKEKYFLFFSPQEMKREGQGLAKKEN